MRLLQSSLHLDNTFVETAAKTEETRRSTLRKPGLGDGLLKIRGVRWSRQVAFGLGLQQKGRDDGEYPEVTHRNEQV